MPPGQQSLPPGNGFQLFVKTLAAVGGTLLSALICWMALSLQELAVDVGQLVERGKSLDDKISRHEIRIDSIGARVLNVEKRSHRHWRTDSRGSTNADPGE